MLPLLFILPCRPGSGHDLDLVRLHSLLALDGLKGDLLTLLQRSEAGALDGAEVDEEVGAVLGGDEAVALLIVEPLDGTVLTLRHCDWTNQADV